MKCIITSRLRAIFGKAGMGVRGKGRRLSPLPCLLDVEATTSARAGVEGANHSNPHPRAGGFTNVARKGIKNEKLSDE
jgi:hypothetical protein